MKRTQLVALFVSVYLITLLALLPAQVAVSLVPLPKGIELSNSEGTVWNASFQYVNAKGLRAEQLAVDLDEWQLLRGRAAVDLTSSVDAPVVVRGNLWASLSRQGAEALTVVMPAGALARQLPLPVPTEVRGRLRLSLPQAEIKDGVCESVTGELTWDDAVISNRFLSAPLRLGNFLAGLRCDNGTLVAEIEDDGPLNLTATVRWMPENKYAIEARVDPDASLPNDIRQGLAFMGEPDGSGFRLTFEGQLAP